MENFWYSAGGCFIGTILGIFLFPYQSMSNPFFLMLLPMWGMVLGAVIGAFAKQKKK